MLDWRKQPVQVSPEVGALPVVARAIREELRKYADDAGRVATLPRSVDPSPQAAAEEVAFTLRARPAEVAIVVEAARQLLDVGALALVDRAVMFPGFVEEQERKSPEAVRKARQREREAASVTVTPPERDISRAQGASAASAAAPTAETPAERDSHAQQAGHVTPASATVTPAECDCPDDETRRDETRREKTREDQRREKPCGSAGAEPAPVGGDLFAGEGVEGKPTPITREAAVAAIAAASGGCFIASKPTKGSTFKLDAQRKANPDGAIFTLIGAWLGAGGDWRTAKGQRLDGRNLGDIEAWAAQARAWDTSGRPSLTGNGNGNGRSHRADGLLDAGSEDALRRAWDGQPPRGTRRRTVGMAPVCHGPPGDPGGEEYSPTDPRSRSGG